MESNILDALTMLVMQSPKYVARTSRVPVTASAAAAAKYGCSPVPASWGALRCPEKTRGHREKAVGNGSSPLVWCLLFEELRSLMDQLAPV